MNALDRLKAAVASDLATPAVSAFDLALVLAVVEAAENAVGNVEDRQERRDLYQALAAIEKGDQ